MNPLETLYIVLALALVVTGMYVWRRYQAVPPAVILLLSALCALVGPSAVPMALWVSAIFLAVYKVPVFAVVAAVVGVAILLMSGEPGSLMDSLRTALGE